MDLYVCMQTHSTCYKSTRKMEIKGILWHSTGANNPYIKRYVQPYEGDPKYNEAIAKLGKNAYGNDWNHIYHEAGLNAWIGKFADGSVGTCQTMPWDYRPWGCGAGSKGSCNNGWIQFEICEDNLQDKNYAQKVWDEAVEFSAYICKLYGLNPLATAKCGSVTVPVITCHNDAYKLGVGSGHSDINHWFPKILGKNMENARQEIATKMGKIPTPTPKPTPQPTDIEQFMWNAFKYLGNYGCAGLLANLKCESAYKSANLQGSFEKKFGMDDETYTAAVDNNAWDFVNDHAGYGLAQWTYYSRKQSLLNYAKSQNKSIGDLDMQIAFCKKELDEYGLTNKLKNCKSAKEASDLVMTVYEKPADQSEAALKKRSDIAEQIYNTYTGTKPSKNYLEKGDSGEDVKTMQTMLIKCGYSCGNAGADGIFGSDTDKAVRAFQTAKNLDVDGLYGPKTKAALEAEYNKSELYRVRKSWEDSKSQIGAYRVYDNAVKQCNENPGYSVYDSNGKCVYTTKKSNEDIAKEVIQGKWGNGTERKQRLTAAGYDYSTVQNIVNQMLK